MYIMSNTSLSIRDADRVLYGLRFLITDIPKSIRGVLKTCPSVQPKFISSGVYYHLGFKTNLLRYVELWLCTIDFDSLNLYINIDGLSMSRSSNQQLWPILGRVIFLGLMTCKEEFLHNSIDMDGADMQAENSHVQYPKFRLFDKFVSPIAK
ncbi:unnamed protein product [Schistosoma curassoni]|uniref:DUF4283 domain-containing protein n=1 Tax=Schistosoma curassoni TaxID=6186 RepID=A0A183K6A6_9TREM|nr:unnamed protein product [Schistosoma curassoni]